MFVAQAAKPEQVAVQVDAGQIVRGVEGENPPAVAGGRGDRHRGDVVRERVAGGPELPLPQAFAVGRGEAQQVQSLLPGAAGASHHDPVAHDDGTGRPATGQGNLPGNIVVRRKRDRQVDFFRGDARVIAAAELPPIGPHQRHNDRRHQQAYCSTATADPFLSQMRNAKSHSLAQGSVCSFWQTFSRITLRPARNVHGITY